MSNLPESSPAITELTKTQLLTQFDEFFSIACSFSANAIVIPNGDNITYAAFIDGMPLPFKVSSEINSLDQSALKPLQAVGSVTDKLMQYLNYQNQKIDLLVSYVVSQQDDEAHRVEGTTLGGGGIIFTANTPFNANDIIELKIFLKSEQAAIYSYGIIVDVNHTETGYHHKVVFKHIRDEDRETLVRASLHLQSKQLKVLSATRSQSKENNE